MKIKELKEYLNTLPPELDNFDIVYSKTKILSESDGTWAREDMPVDSIVVDQDHEEMCLGLWETIETMLKMTEGVQSKLPDGNYDCLWSGYEVKIEHNGETFTFDTHVLGIGVKGMNCPAIATIINGEITDARG